MGDMLMVLTTVSRSWRLNKITTCRLLPKTLTSLFLKTTFTVDIFRERILHLNLKRPEKKEQVAVDIGKVKHVAVDFGKVKRVDPRERSEQQKTPASGPPPKAL